DQRAAERQERCDHPLARCLHAGRRQGEGSRGRFRRGLRDRSQSTAGEIRPPLLTLAMQRTIKEEAMKLYVIRRPSAWANAKELETIGARSAKIGNEEMSDTVRWIRTYVVQEPDGRLGSFCIYEAKEPQAIREHARRVGMPGDLIY